MVCNTIAGEELTCDGQWIRDDGVYHHYKNILRVVRELGSCP